MRAGRNPRRAYDEHGNELPPATVESQLAVGRSSDSRHCPPPALFQMRLPGHQDNAQSHELYDRAYGRRGEESCATVRPQVAPIARDDP